jgi:hypothetical protein
VPTEAAGSARSTIDRQIYCTAASLGCEQVIADILNSIANSMLMLRRALGDGRGAVMAALQGFLLGLMVSWTPSLIFLACIAVQAGARRHLIQVRQQPEASETTDGMVFDASPRLFRGRHS